MTDVRRGRPKGAAGFIYPRAVGRTTQARLRNKAPGEGRASRFWPSGCPPKPSPPRTIKITAPRTGTPLRSPGDVAGRRVAASPPRTTMNDAISTTTGDAPTTKNDEPSVQGARRLAHPRVSVNSLVAPLHRRCNESETKKSPYGAGVGTLVNIVSSFHVKVMVCGTGRRPPAAGRVGAGCSITYPWKRETVLTRWTVSPPSGDCLVSPPCNETVKRAARFTEGVVA